MRHRLSPGLFVTNPALLDDLPHDSDQLDRPPTMLAHSPRETRLIDIITGYTPSADGESPTSGPDLEDKLDPRRSYACHFPGQYVCRYIQLRTVGNLDRQKASGVTTLQCKTRPLPLWMGHTSHTSTAAATTAPFLYFFADFFGVPSK